MNKSATFTVEYGEKDLKDIVIRQFVAWVNENKKISVIISG